MALHQQLQVFTVTADQTQRARKLKMVSGLRQPIKFTVTRYFDLGPENI